MSSYSESQVHQLMEALEKKGEFTAHDITLLGQLSKESLLQVRDMLRGKAEIIYSDHIIDCDADPDILDGWSVVKHQKGGQFNWNPNDISFYSDIKRDCNVDGNEIRKKLEGKSLLNANVLNHLLGNPQLIPGEWEGKFIFFWGTIYSNSDGQLYVRYLCQIGGEWSGENYWLGDPWLNYYLVAILRK